MAQMQTSRRIHLLANSKSGKGKGEDLIGIAERLCNEHGATLIKYETQNLNELESKIDAAVNAAKSPNDIVVAAGGDGTIRSVAEKASRKKAILAVVPCGTFNFFARAHNIPEDHEQALVLAITGEPQPVRLGDINGRTFLVNASLGLYAKSIQEREVNTSRFGRNRIVAILSTFYTLLRPHRLLEVHFKSLDLQKVVRTPMIFIGNNALQLRNLSMSVADCFRNNLLAIVTLKPVRGWEMVRVILRGITKTINSENRVTQFGAEYISIATKRAKQTVALDGEMFQMTSPFVVRSLPQGLNLIQPKIQPSTLPHSESPA